VIIQFQFRLEIKTKSAGYYLLDYIDSPPLRRDVQRALNRGENYHKLRRAVSYANFGKLRFKTKQEKSEGKAYTFSKSGMSAAV